MFGKRVYLNENSFYVKRDNYEKDNVINIYQVQSYVVNDTVRYIFLDLDLIAQILEDSTLISVNDTDGNFSETELCYIIDESFKECLKANDYEILSDEEVEKLEKLCSL